MAGVMAQCGGLECMLNRLAGIKDFKQGRHLLTVSWRQQSGTSHLTLEGSMVPYEPERVKKLPGNFPKFSTLKVHFMLLSFWSASRKPE